ncbi:hypothetical protein Tco_0467629, partial [Tanacetum coccineum]
MKFDGGAPQLNIKDQQDLSEHQGFNTRAFKDGDFNSPSLDDYRDWFNPNTSYRSSDVLTSPVGGDIPKSPLQ